MDKTISKRLSNQINPVIEIVPKDPSQCQQYCGFRDITLKDILTMLFTLLIPAMIGILAVVLQKNEIDLTEKGRQNDFRIGQLQRKSDSEQTEALGNETILNNYIKNIIDMTLYYKTDGTDSPQYKMTRVLTITALRQLSLEKKKLVVQFLYDIEFAKRGQFIFYNRDRLEDVKHLQGAIFDNVDLGHGLKLPAIILRRVALINASFSTSDLEDADFTDSNLSRVNFSQTNLAGARFFNTQLQQTDFHGAFLENAQFVQSNLTGSNITDDQLSQTLTIFNTILPNGTYARNKTFIINGDAKQGLNGWNVTSGEIRVNDFYFYGNKNSTMIQRINATNASLIGSYASFEYCLSFSVQHQEYFIVEIGFLDNNLVNIGMEKFFPRSNSCENNSSNSLNFCYWSICKNSKSTTYYMDLKFTFGSINDTMNRLVALKDIQVTIIAE